MGLPHTLSAHGPALYLVGTWACPIPCQHMGDRPPVPRHMAQYSWPVPKCLFYSELSPQVPLYQWTASLRGTRGLAPLCRLLPGDYRPSLRGTWGLSPVYRPVVDTITLSSHMGLPYTLSAHGRQAPCTSPQGLSTVGQSPSASKVPLKCLISASIEIISCPEVNEKSQAPEFIILF